MQLSVAQSMPRVTGGNRNGAARPAPQQGQVEALPRSRLPGPRGAVVLASCGVVRAPAAGAGAGPRRLGLLVPGRAMRSDVAAAPTAEAEQRAEPSAAPGSAPPKVSSGRKAVCRTIVFCIRHCDAAWGAATTSQSLTASAGIGGEKYFR